MNREQGVKIKEALGVLAGMASMCWSEEDIFLSDRASQAVDQTFTKIKMILNNEEIAKRDPADRWDRDFGQLHHGHDPEENEIPGETL